MVIICLVVVTVVVLVYGVFQCLSYRKYYDFFVPLDNKTYSYKKFLPGCLGIVEMLKLSGAGRYRTKLNQKLVMLWKPQYIYYTKVHWSVNIIFIFGVIIGPHS